MLDKLELITDKQYLQANLSFFALYISLYENFVDSVEERVKSFLCSKSNVNQDGNLEYEENDIYRTQIRNRRVDEKGNKNNLLASMLWLMDMDAIDQAEYKSFLHLKELRNSYAHKLADHVWSGVSWDDLASFDKLFELYTKIDQWWINEVEIPVAGVEKLSDEEAQSVSNSALFILKRMRLTLYGESQNR